MCDCIYLRGTDHHTGYAKFSRNGVSEARCGCASRFPSQFCGRGPWLCRRSYVLVRISSVTWIDIDLIMNRLAQCVSMATLTAAAVRAADAFSDGKGVGRKSLIGIIMGLCTITLLSNLCGIKVSSTIAISKSKHEVTYKQVYANIERVVLWFKFCLLILVCLLMILVKAGGLKPDPLLNNAANFYFSSGVRKSTI